MSTLIESNLRNQPSPSKLDKILTDLVGFTFTKGQIFPSSHSAQVLFPKFYRKKPLIFRNTDEKNTDDRNLLNARLHGDEIYHSVYPTSQEKVPWLRFHLIRHRTSKKTELLAEAVKEIKSYPTFYLVILSIRKFVYVQSEGDILIEFLKFKSQSYQNQKKRNQNQANLASREGNKRRIPK